MKNLVAIDKAVGSDGLEVTGAIGIKGSDMALQLSLKYPIEQIIQPATKILDELIDKLEKIIPGDQIALADRLKAEAKAKLVELLSE